MTIRLEHVFVVVVQIRYLILSFDTFILMHSFDTFILMHFVDTFFLMHFVVTFILMYSFWYFHFDTVLITTNYVCSSLMYSVHCTNVRLYVEDSSVRSTWWTRSCFLMKSNWYRPPCWYPIKQFLMMLGGLCLINELFSH